MSQQGVFDIEKKGGRPRKLIEIARVCGVSPEWLLGETDSKTGSDTGAPLPERQLRRQGQVPIQSPMSSRKTLPEYDIRAGASYGGGMDDEEWRDGDISGHAPVAQWGLPPAYVERELGLSYGFADVIPVRGDSMDDGTVHALVSGDRVIIDRKDKDPRQGGVFAVWDGGGVIVKQVELVRGDGPPRIICSSRNPHYKPIELVLDGSVHVIGRVAAKVSRV